LNHHKHHHKNQDAQELDPPHLHQHDVKGRKLIFSIFLNLSISLVEIIGGIVSGSIALFSDAIHNLTDTTALFIAYIANRVGKRKTNLRKTYGYKRIEIIAALFNSSVLIGICLFLIFEAIRRFLHPKEIESGIMIVVAIFGLLANLFSVMILHKEKNSNINIKAAYLHLLGDTLSSVAVVVGGVIIFYLKCYWLDAVLTLLISLYIIKETFGILKQSYKILMQEVPKDVHLEKIKDRLEKLEGLDNIHHLHAWTLNDSSLHFECHIDLAQDTLVSQTKLLHETINQIMRVEFGFSHITLQFEYASCSDKSLVQQE